MVTFEDTTNSSDLAACVYECAAGDTLRITVKFDHSHQADLVFELSKPDAPVSPHVGGGVSGSAGSGR